MLLQSSKPDGCMEPSVGTYTLFKSAALSFRSTSTYTRQRESRVCCAMYSVRCHGMYKMWHEEFEAGGVEKEGKPISV